MVNTKSNFEKRKKEIDEYFSFLKVLNKNNIFLKYDDHDDFSKEFPISIELQKILAANTFLLLYNEKFVLHVQDGFFYLLFPLNVCHYLIFEIQFHKPNFLFF
jgi:hypothetical protein